MTPLVVHFGLAGRDEQRTNEEDDVSAEIQAWYEDYKRQLRAEGRKEGRDEGRKEGRAEEAAHAVLTVLRARGIPVPDAARERIVAEKDAARLSRWLERAATASSIADVVDDPS